MFIFVVCMISGLRLQEHASLEPSLAFHLWLRKDTIY
jgi:hypothetical protein